MHKAARALQGEIVVVPFEHSPCDPWELARTLEQELAAMGEMYDAYKAQLTAAIEARNAAVQRCAEIVDGLTANRNGVLATIRAEFPEAFISTNKGA